MNVDEYNYKIFYIFPFYHSFVRVQITEMTFVLNKCVKFQLKLQIYGSYGNHLLVK